MRNLRLLFVLLLLSPAIPALGQVYQSTDEQGNVSFSDTPTPDSKKIVVPETNVGDSVEVPPPAPEPEPEPEVVVEEIPQAPQGELYVKEKDSSSHRRRRPRPEPRSGGGNHR